MANTIPPNYLIQYNTSDAKDGYETTADLFLAPLRNMCGYSVTKYDHANLSFYGSINSKAVNLISQIGWAILTVLTLPFLLIGLILNSSSSTHDQHLQNKQLSDQEVAAWDPQRKTIYHAYDEDNQTIIDIYKRHQITEDGLNTVAVSKLNQTPADYSALVRFANAHHLDIISKQQTLFQSIPLGDRWQFPSDHLPVGAVVDGFNIATFNVLNSSFLRYIAVDNTTKGQGLNGSMITASNIPDIGGNPVSQRELRIIVVIQTMLGLNQSVPITHPMSVISLQECSSPFITELFKYLPAHFKVLYTDVKAGNNRHAMIYDDRLFDCQGFNPAQTFQYPSDSGNTKPLMEATLTDRATGKKYQFFNVHIPGHPSNKNGISELAGQVNLRADVSATTIVLGDCNFGRDDIRAGFQTPMVGATTYQLTDEQMDDNFEMWGTYNTNVSLLIKVSPLDAGSRKADALDHIIIWGPNKPEVADLTPNEVLPGLQALVDLL